MFKIFWHKYVFHRTENSWMSFVKNDDMVNWCKINIGKYGDKWDYRHQVIGDVALSPEIKYTVFRFKRKDDYVMFKMCNL